MYCNYSKNKFGNELTFIKPTWATTEDYPNSNNASFAFNEFYEALEKIEDVYKTLIENGWQAQQAAEILPQCIKGDMIITGFEDDWKHLLDLRYFGTTGAPHPMVKELATLMKEELEKLGLQY